MKNRKMVFATDGGNGSFIEFKSGQFIDTVEGDSATNGIPSDYDAAVEYANDNGYIYATKDEWAKWTQFDTTTDIDEYVGA
ncbi:MAG: hypothetical protein GY938_16800 [Ketobacter sp.]|nr:hypothetical protein [Ketobacter sp.]